MSIMKNKYVYYAVSILAILNVVGYFSLRAWPCIVMFAAVAYSANCYSGNPTIALLSGLFVANFVFGCNQVKESFNEAREPFTSIIEKLKNLTEGMENEAKQCAEDEMKNPKYDGTDEAIKQCIPKLDQATEAMKVAKDVIGKGGIKSIMDTLTRMKP